MIRQKFFPEKYIRTKTLCRSALLRLSKAESECSMAELIRALSYKSQFAQHGLTSLLALYTSSSPFFHMCYQTIHKHRTGWRIMLPFIGFPVRQFEAYLTVFLSSRSERTYKHQTKHTSCQCSKGVLCFLNRHGHHHRRLLPRQPAIAKLNLQSQKKKNFAAKK